MVVTIFNFFSPRTNKRKESSAITEGEVAPSPAKKSFSVHLSDQVKENESRDGVSSSSMNIVPPLDNVDETSKEIGPSSLVHQTKANDIDDEAGVHVGPVNSADKATAIEVDPSVVTSEGYEGETLVDHNGALAALADLKAALDMPEDNSSKRIKVVGRALVDLKEAQQSQGITDDEIGASPLCEEANKAIRQWKASLGVKDEVDARSLKDGKWYGAILDAEGKSEDGMESFWTVRFKRFAARHNENFNQDDSGLERLMPLGSYTAKRRKKKLHGGLAVLEKEAAGPVDPSVETFMRREKRQLFWDETPLEVVGTTRFGRSVKSSESKISALKKKVASSNRKKPNGLQEPSPEEQKAATAGAEENEGSFVIDTGGKDANDWVCGICDELERSEADRLVLCDGPCLRSFHQSCLGLTSQDVDSLREWFCEQCQEKDHTCFICGDGGKDDVAGGVHKCRQATCGKFYHQHCVSQLANAMIAKKQDEVVDDAAFRFKFTCPMHICDVCGKGKESMKYRNKLFSCWHCTRAYHMNCIPPTCKYHEYLLLCPDHAHHDLPHLPGTETVDQEPDTTVVRAEGWPSVVFSILAPRSKCFFRLPASLFDEVHSKPRPFGHISVTKYLCKIPLKEPGPECQCVESCGDDCLNRLLHIECVGNGPGITSSSSGSAPGSSSSDKYHNCHVGPNCGNRVFKDKEYIKHQVFKEYGCGWGLKTLEDVKKGQLVFEYVGEAIDDEELERRLRVHAQEHPNDHNMYVMELENGYYLDARNRGNASRFINHSCAPNCELQKWNVRGVTRIGIVAVQDIPAGRALSYDYQFATNEEGKFKCSCGAKNCRGSLAPKTKYSEEEEMEALRKSGSRVDRKKLLELYKKREKREEARKKERERQREEQKNLTCPYLPGDPTLEIRAGPPLRFFQFARETRIYLPRNVKKANDFLQRRELMMERGEIIRSHLASRPT